MIPVLEQFVIVTVPDSLAASDPQIPPQRLAVIFPVLEQFEIVTIPLIPPTA